MLRALADHMAEHPAGVSGDGRASIGRGREPWIPKSPAWWQRVMQIYPWSFADASGDGIGDLRGIREHAEYLGWLGIDAVWLSPIFPSPGVDLGYDVSDYRDVDPRWDAPDLDDLVAALHAVDVRLILDLVPNHSSDRHPWFEESRRDRTNPATTGTSGAIHRPTGRPRTTGRATSADRRGPSSIRRASGTSTRSIPVSLTSTGTTRPCARRSGTRCGSGSAGVDGFRIDVLWLLGKDPRARQRAEPRLARRAPGLPASAPRPLGGRTPGPRVRAVPPRGDRRVPRPGHDRRGRAAAGTRGRVLRHRPARGRTCRTISPSCRNRA